MMETLRLWADFRIGQQLYMYDHCDPMGPKFYWRPVSKARLVCAWLRDLFAGERDARLAGFQGWMYCEVKGGEITSKELMGLNDEIEVL